MKSSLSMMPTVITIGALCKAVLWAYNYVLVTAVSMPKTSWVYSCKWIDSNCQIGSWKKDLSKVQVSSTIGHRNQALTNPAYKTVNINRSKKWAARKLVANVYRVWRNLKKKIKYFQNQAAKVTFHLLVKQGWKKINFL